jgi:hypothetical protein
MFLPQHVQNISLSLSSPPYYRKQVLDEPQPGPRVGGWVLESASSRLNNEGEGAMMLRYNIRVPNGYQLISFE